MNKSVYPFIALGLGLLLMFTLMGATTLAASGKPLVPLLALLIMSEFGFITTGIGAIVGLMALKQTQRKFRMALTAIACGAMSVRFMLLGIEFWPL